MNVVGERQRNADRRRDRGPREGEHVGVDAVEHLDPAGPLDGVGKTVAEAMDDGDGRPAGRHIRPDRIEDGLAAEHRRATGGKDQFLIGDLERAGHDGGSSFPEIDGDVGAAIAHVEAPGRSKLGAETDDLVAAVGERAAGWWQSIR